MPEDKNVTVVNPPLVRRENESADIDDDVANRDRSEENQPPKYRAQVKKKKEEAKLPFRTDDKVWLELDEISYPLKVVRVGFNKELGVYQYQLQETNGEAYKDNEWVSDEQLKARG